MRPFLICLICLAVPPVLRSQETNEPASEQQADTLQPTIVTYSADQVEYTPSTGRMVLRDGAQVRYKDITVEADTIRFDSKPREVFAEGTPVLMSGSDTLYGRRMGYELETKRGFVENGRTKIEKGWLTGELIRVVGENTFNIDHGTFTTCEHDPPHYCFVSRRMKVYANDMAVCEPVVLKVRAVPVLAVPFMLMARMLQFGREIPFGPWLSAGTLVAMLFCDKIERSVSPGLEGLYLMLRGV